MAGIRLRRKTVQSPCSTVKSHFSTAVKQVRRSLTKRSKNLTPLLSSRSSTASQKPRQDTGFFYYCKYLEPNERAHNSQFWADAHKKYNRLSRREKAHWGKICLDDNKADVRRHDGYQVVEEPKKEKIICAQNDMVSSATATIAPDTRGGNAVAVNSTTAAPTEAELIARAVKSSGFLIYMHVAHDMRAPTVQDIKDWRRLSNIDHAVLAAICDHRNFLEEAGFVQKLEGDFPCRHVNNTLLWNPVSRFMIDKCTQAKTANCILQVEKDFFNMPREMKEMYLKARM